uniref:Uncharacterized protein n=1 Tax=Romanomermis culicivorax TaxID=13658 RepID=A0A915L1N8_ROMCU
RHVAAKGYHLNQTTPQNVPWCHLEEILEEEGVEEVAVEQWDQPFQADPHHLPTLQMEVAELTELIFLITKASIRILANCQQWVTGSFPDLPCQYHLQTGTCDTKPFNDELLETPIFDGNIAELPTGLFAHL